MPVNNVKEFRKNGVMLGWYSKVTRKRATSFITINKLICDGCGIKKGDELHCYFLEEDGKPVIKIYLPESKGDVLSRNIKER